MPGLVSSIGASWRGEAHIAILASRIGIVIGGADGDFDATERAVVRDACFALDLPPHEFDL